MTRNPGSMSATTWIVQFHNGMAVSSIHPDEFTRDEAKAYLIQMGREGIRCSMRRKRVVLGPARFEDRLTKACYHIVLIDAQTGVIKHRERPMSLKKALRWLKAWEQNPSGMVAIAWPSWAPPLKSTCVA